jgi:predicted nucleic acid-binding protein
MNRRMVLVDTSVWSLALRRKQPGREAEILGDLLQDMQVAMVGPVRQELLSGIREKSAYNKLRHQLAALDDWPIATVDYETAAEFSNTCRRKGITGSPYDFLICAVAHRGKMSIWTTDQDFTYYAKHLPIDLVDL